jgi:hypothetical protein
MRILLFTLALIAANPINAVELVDDVRHTVSLNIGYGSMTTPNRSESNGIVSILSLDYAYKYDPNWSIGLTSAVVEEPVCVFICAGGREPDLNRRHLLSKSFSLYGKRHLSLTDCFSVNGKFGASYHQTQFKKGYRKTVSTRGVGAVLGTGLLFQCSGGIGLGFEATAMTLDEADTLNYTLNFIYSF